MGCICDACDRHCLIATVTSFGCMSLNGYVRICISDISTINILFPSPTGT